MRLIDTVTRGEEPDHRRRPPHLDDQRDRVTRLFATDGPAWLLFFDGGRYDLFDQLVWDYFDGELDRVWNGGVGYTGDWAVRTLDCGGLSDRALYSDPPLFDMDGVNYDAREHFEDAPELQPDVSVEERLAALGYRDAPGRMRSDAHLSPPQINDCVTVDSNGGVVRYLDPHPPLIGQEGLTSGRGKTEATRQALGDGRLSHEGLLDAYIDTYERGFRAARKLVPNLPGRVVLTADHGECLGDCGQLFHGRRHDKHDHLCTVPWFEVGGVK